jgi:cysteinyl-tRNA synthetase
LLASLFEFVNRVSPPLAGGLFSEQERNRILDCLKGVNAVLGIMNFAEEVIGEEARLLLEEREMLRKQRRWADADNVRARLLDFGVEISDTPDGAV